MFTAHEITTINKAISIIESKRYKGTTLNCVELAKKEAILSHSNLEREVFTVFTLTSQFQIIEKTHLFLGTINSSIVYIREIIKHCLKFNASALIISHNHPSGSLIPSQSDIKITQKIDQALNIFDIKLVDHIITSFGDSFSFAENGLI